MKTDIYISHAWEKQSDDVLYPLLDRLKREKFKIVYDHQDLGYRGRISQFMDELAESEAIIIIVSNKYLKSEYCMYELLKIYEQKDIQNRIYPIVLPEVNIAKSTDRLNLVKYWEQESKDLMNKIKELDDITFLDGITDDLNLYKSIRNKIAKLTYILKDINTLQVHIHQERNFDDLVEALKSNKLHKDPSRISIPKFEKEDRKNVLLPVAVVAACFLIGILLFNIFDREPDPLDNGLLSEKQHPEVELQQEEIKEVQPIQLDSINVDELEDSSIIAEQSMDINDTTDMSVTPESGKAKISKEPKSNSRKSESLENIAANAKTEKPASEASDIIRAGGIDPRSKALVQEADQNVSETITDEIQTVDEKELSTPVNDEISYKRVLLKRNTPILIKPKTLISSGKLLKGDYVYFSVAKPVIIDNTEVISTGAEARGVVERVQSYQNSKRATIEFNLEFVESSEKLPIAVNMTYAKSSRKFDIEISPDQLIEVKTSKDEKVNGKVML